MRERFAPTGPVHASSLVLALAALAALAACGSDGARTSATVAGSGGPGGGGSGGAGGEGGAPPYACDAPADPGTPLICAPGEASLVGELDHAPADLKLMVGGFLESDSSAVMFGEGGLAFFPSVHISPGKTVQSTALFRFPDFGSHAGEWVCAGKGSMASVDANNEGGSVTLDSLALLGGCPGTPVAGEVDGCFYDPDCPKQGLTSTLAGASFDLPASAGITSTVTGSIRGVAKQFLEGGFLELDADDIDPSVPNTPTTKHASKVRGYLIVPLGQPDAGAAYCIGAPSTLEYRLKAGAFVLVSASLKNLSRVGSCSQATHCVAGQLRMCQRFPP